MLRRAAQPRRDRRMVHVTRGVVRWDAVRSGRRGAHLVNGAAILCCGTDALIQKARSGVRVRESALGARSGAGGRKSQHVVRVQAGGDHHTTLLQGAHSYAAERLHRHTVPTASDALVETQKRCPSASDETAADRACTASENVCVHFKLPLCKSKRHVRPFRELSQSAQLVSGIVSLAF